MVHDPKWEATPSSLWSLANCYFYDFLLIFSDWFLLLFWEHNWYIWVDSFPRWSIIFLLESRSRILRGITFVKMFSCKWSNIISSCVSFFDETRTKIEDMRFILSEMGTCFGKEWVSPLICKLSLLLTFQKIVFWIYKCSYVIEIMHDDDSQDNSFIEGSFGVPQIVCFFSLLCYNR